MSKLAIHGVVLAGGGARAAFEAGVLRWIATEVPKVLGHPVRFEVIVGTSAGAINGAILAADCTDWDRATEALLDHWKRTTIPAIYRMGLRQLWRVPMTLLTGRRSRGEIALLDTSALRGTLRTRVPWSGISDAVAAGRLRAFAVTATELSTSRNIVFYEAGPECTDLLRSRNPYVRPHPVRMGPEHVLASAAIPLFFPPVKVEGQWFADGGLGQNTPLGPAIRLGADRILVITLRAAMSVESGDERAARLGGRAPSWAQVLGKTMNTVLLDKAAHDVERIERMNSILRWGTREYGADFQQRFGRMVEGERGAPYRPLRVMLLAPSVDLGALAQQVALADDFRDLDPVTRRMLRGLARAVGASDNDALSYLLFTRTYIDRLIELGHEDAEARRDELVAFFAEPGDKT
jgi:NTE family protein